MFLHGCTYMAGVNEISGVADYNPTAFRPSGRGSTALYKAPLRNLARETSLFRILMADSAVIGDTQPPKLHSDVAYPVHQD